MKWSWLIASTLCLSGCLSNTALQYDAVSCTNLYRMTKVRKGMSEREVLAIMRQPYRYECFELGDDIYDVWFYVTQKTVLGQSRMVPQNLTPLSFKNGILAGTGYDYYYFIMREQAKEDAAKTPPPPPPPAPPPIREPSTSSPGSSSPAENIELEKSLRKAFRPSQKTPAVPAQKEDKGAPATESPGDLQKVSRPTAPIISSSPSSPATKAPKKESSPEEDPHSDSSEDPDVDGYDQEGEERENQEIEEDFNSW